MKRLHMSWERKLQLMQQLVEIVDEYLIGVYEDRRTILRMVVDF